MGWTINNKQSIKYFSIRQQFNPTMNSLLTIYRRNFASYEIQLRNASLSGGPVLCHLVPEERDTAGQLVHAFHPILNADPAIEAYPFELGEDGVIIVEPL